MTCRYFLGLAHRWLGFPFFVQTGARKNNSKTSKAKQFDAPNVELGHHGTQCSFDAVIIKYNLNDPALLKLAVIVRGADTNANDLAPECRGLEAIAEGFRLAYANDHDLLERELSVYDALYAYCRQSINQNTPGDDSKN